MLCLLTECSVWHVRVRSATEYWSWEMRDAVDTFTAAGGMVARLAGNFFWQVRFEDDGATQVCYKYAALKDGVSL